MHYNYYDQNETFYQITKEGGYCIAKRDNTVVLKEICEDVIQYDSVLVTIDENGYDIYFPHRVGELDYDETKKVYCGFKNAKVCKYFKHSTRVNYGLLIVQCSDGSWVATIPDYVDWQYPEESIEDRIARLPKFYTDSERDFEVIDLLQGEYILSFLVKIGECYRLLKIRFLTESKLDYFSNHYIEVISENLEKAETIPNVKNIFKAIDCSEKLCNAEGEIEFGPFDKIVKMAENEYPGTYKYFHEHYTGFWGLNSEGEIEAFTLLKNDGKEINSPYPYTINLDTPATKMIFFKRKTWNFVDSKNHHEKFIDIWKIYRGESYKLLFQIINNVSSSKASKFRLEFELDDEDLVPEI